MPLSPSLDLVTVTGSYVDSTGAPVAGTVTFTPSHTLYDLVADQVILPKQVTATLVGGQFSIDLPATNDPDLTPTDIYYTVTEAFTGGVVGTTFVLLLPHDQTTVDIAARRLADDSAPGSPVYTVGTLAALSDVDALNRADGRALVWDATASAHEYAQVLDLTAGDARYVRTVGGVAPDGAGNVPGLDTVQGDARYVRTVGGIAPDGAGDVPGSGCSALSVVWQPWKIAVTTLAAASGDVTAIPLRTLGVEWLPSTHPPNGAAITKSLMYSWPETSNTAIPVVTAGKTDTGGTFLSSATVDGTHPAFAPWTYRVAVTPIFTDSDVYNFSHAIGVAGYATVATTTDTSTLTVSWAAYSNTGGRVVGAVVWVLIPAAGGTREWRPFKVVSQSQSLTLAAGSVTITNPANFFSGLSSTSFTFLDSKQGHAVARQTGAAFSTPFDDGNTTFNALASSTEDAVVAVEAAVEFTPTAGALQTGDVVTLGFRTPATGTLQYIRHPEPFLGEFSMAASHGPALWGAGGGQAVTTELSVKTGAATRTVPLVLTRVRISVTRWEVPQI